MGWIRKGNDLHFVIQLLLFHEGCGRSFASYAVAVKVWNGWKKVHPTAPVGLSHIMRPAVNNMK
jgi:hypothetical protein